MPPPLKQILATRDAVFSATQDRAAATAPTTSRMAGKVGIITGVGPVSGIGTKSARLFAREGAAHLFLLDLSPQLPAFAAALAAEFPQTKVTHVTGDASSERVVSALVARALTEASRLDVFFANAGVNQIRDAALPPPKDAAEAADRDVRLALRPTPLIPSSEFDDVMRINVRSVWLAVKYAPAAMARVGGAGKAIPGGSVIATASVAALAAGAGPLVYSASKAAVASIVKSAAYELAGTNVRVNALAPGLIHTDMTHAMFEKAQASGKSDLIGQLNPLLRHGLPEEIAQAALFLASDDASYVNGQVLPVDGGLSASLPYAVPGAGKSKPKAKL